MEHLSVRVGGYCRGRESLPGGSRPRPLREVAGGYSKAGASCDVSSLWI